MVNGCQRSGRFIIYRFLLYRSFSLNQPKDRHWPGWYCMKTFCKRYWSSILNVVIPDNWQVPITASSKRNVTGSVHQMRCIDASTANSEAPNLCQNPLELKRLGTKIAVAPRSNNED